MKRNKPIIGIAKRGVLAAVFLLLAGVVTVRAGTPYPPPQIKNSPREGWEWKFRDFVIGGWWGPAFSDAEVKLYKECGFNVVMCGRYMQLETYGDTVQAPKELDLAQKYGLGVMFDTYTKNDKPWGGKKGQVDGHRRHHAASLIELKWLYEHLGKHPALVGFMIGDDKSKLTPRLKDITRYLREEAPHLMPWICQNKANAESLAENGNPIYDVQIYPTFYAWGQSAEKHVLEYIKVYAKQREESRRLDLLFWPMFNVANRKHGKTGDDMFGYCPSDSLVRFPAYAALAYGAQGIWYFTYNGGSLQHVGPHETEDDARKALTPLYAVVKKQNLRIAAWGPRLLGTDSVGLFGSHAQNAAGPSQETRPDVEGLTAPRAGKLVEKLDEKLIVGILVKKGAAPMAMVVDCRCSKKFGDIEPRTVEVTFSDKVNLIRALATPKGDTVTKGRTVKLTLEAGGGQLLELQGTGLETLTTTDAIYK